VGIAPTQELISRDGMIQPGINTRVGPICRNVRDAAKILTAHPGYDAKDELTVFSVGRMPPMPYEAYAAETRLDGVRIGVVRELFDKTTLTPAAHETVDLIDRAVVDLASIGPEIVDPGPGNALLASCVRKYAPKLAGHLFTAQHPDMNLDAMAYATNNTPPEKLGSPNTGGGGRGRTSSSSLGGQGFPAITSRARSATSPAT
jgi:Asp-tRNA(Asn)/Glu-tRNA(Gln) amidotransferase A subunit family amidase